jgi:UDP-N-acetylenolpyruvoylglucosamine reductase
MQTYLGDELTKVGFDKQRLFVAQHLKELNHQIEQALQQTSSSFPLLVFKGSQNTIFLEESVKHFLLTPSDEQFLTRQGTWWSEKKKEFVH